MHTWSTIRRGFSSREFLSYLWSLCIPFPLNPKKSAFTHSDGQHLRSHRVDGNRFRNYLGVMLTWEQERNRHCQCQCQWEAERLGDIKATEVKSLESRMVYVIFQLGWVALSSIPHWPYPVVNVTVISHESKRMQIFIRTITLFTQALPPSMFVCVQQDLPALG